MFVVTYYHPDGYCHFIGVAHTRQQAEEIVRIDIANVGKDDKSMYNITQVCVDYPNAFCIEEQCRNEPYEVQ